MNIDSELKLIFVVNILYKCLWF